MECPICLNHIKESVIGSCTHHFCRLCLIKWCEFGGTNCPTCKTPITQIREDKEFDYLNNKDIDRDSDRDSDRDRDRDNRVKSLFNREIKINFRRDDKIGITIENYYTHRAIGTRGPGVIITKLNPDGKCYREGLRIKDIILSINNIPCVDHKQTIDIINQCNRESSTMICSLLDKTQL